MKKRKKTTPHYRGDDKKRSTAAPESHRRYEAGYVGGQLNTPVDDWSAWKSNLSIGVTFDWAGVNEARRCLSTCTWSSRRGMLSRPEWHNRTRSGGGWSLAEDGSKPSWGECRRNRPSLGRGHYPWTPFRYGWWFFALLGMSTWPLPDLACNVGHVCGSRPPLAARVRRARNFHSDAAHVSLPPFPLRSGERPHPMRARTEDRSSIDTTLVPVLQ